MRKITSKIIMAALWLLAAMPVTAQDQRQRKPETIVQDVLAQMPTPTQEDFNRELGDLAKGAPQTVAILCRMLQPAEKASNNMVEYAISGVVAYASANSQYTAAVRQALEEAISSAPDQTAKDFLQSQLRLIATSDKIEYTNHAGTQPYAQLYDDIMAAGGACAPIVTKALKSKDRAYRVEALKLASNYADNAMLAAVCKKYNSLSDEGKEDVLAWLGDNKAANQLTLVLKEIKKGKATAPLAIETAGRIGGSLAVSALLTALQGPHSTQALEALKSIKDDLSNPVSVALIQAEGDHKLSLISLASSRRIKAVAPQILEMVQSSDATLAEAALKALPGVISSKYVPQAATLLDKADNGQASAYQQVFMAAVNDLPVDGRYTAISSAMKGTQHPDRFYPALASTNTDQSVTDLTKAWEGGSAPALQALTGSTNYKAAAPLLKAAQQGDEQALAAYVKLTETHHADLDARTGRLAEALKCAKTTQSKTRVINSLGNTPTRNSFLLVGECLNDKEVAYPAALAQKNIARKCLSDIDYKDLQAQMGKCVTILEEHGKATGNPDDGYAVDEIKKMLAEVKPSPVYELTEEEKAAGYEILFDGTNLDKWTGNKVGYIVVNGVIYVTANYGNESNLYTVDEYTDFTFRFDFCFTKPGVNNGVGIRTPMGVDAAYYGMCECQILDHDDPIYSGLHEYQVHGSAYGIIPAKRLKHKPLGEWSTEEIVVKGDHIKVTVNGEVILDGNLREACKGHNVAPDGSDNNPYTVDHRNHPGMFNKSGHIGFLGHGEGLKFRNVRVLDMSKKSAKRKK